MHMNQKRTEEVSIRTRDFPVIVTNESSQAGELTLANRDQADRQIDRQTG